MKRFLLEKFSPRNKQNLKKDIFIHFCYLFCQLGRYFWHVQIRIHTGKMTALSSFRIYCLDVIKMAKLLTREMLHAPVNNYFFRFRLFS